MKILIVKKAYAKLIYSHKINYCNFFQQFYLLISFNYYIFYLFLFPLINNHRAERHEISMMPA